MKWWKLPGNLLQPDPLVEVIVTCDKNGGVRCTTSILEDGAPAIPVVSSLLAAANAVMGEAQRVAQENKVTLQAQPDGNILVG